MRGTQIGVDDDVEPLLNRHFLHELEPVRDRSVARREVRVEAAMGEAHELHQADAVEAVGAALPQAVRGVFDNPAPCLQPVALHVAHDRPLTIFRRMAGARSGTTTPSGPGYGGATIHRQSRMA